MYIYIYIYTYIYIYISSTKACICCNNPEASITISKHNYTFFHLLTHKNMQSNNYHSLEF